MRGQEPRPGQVEVAPAVPTPGNQENEVLGEPPVDEVGARAHAEELAETPDVLGKAILLFSAERILRKPSRPGGPEGPCLGYEAE